MLIVLVHLSILATLTVHLYIVDLFTLIILGEQTKEMKYGPPSTQQTQ